MNNFFISNQFDISVPIPTKEDHSTNNLGQDMAISYSPSAHYEAENPLWKQMTSSTGLARETHFSRESSSEKQQHHKSPSPQYTVQVQPQQPMFASSSLPEGQQKAYAIQNQTFAPVHFQACVGTGLSSLDRISNVNQGDANGNTGVMFAVNCHNLSMLQTLIARLANVNEQNHAGETALFIAAARGYLDCVQLLVEHGANPHIPTLEGATCAHIAAAHGHVLVLEYLNKVGSNLQIQDEVGDSPLHWAVRENQPECVRFLAEVARVNLLLENEDNETPRQLASCLGETLIEQLLAHYETPSEQVLQNQIFSLHF